MKRQLTSLLGALGLALVLLGMPALLIATHNAAPPRFGWSLEGLWHALTTPDDGSLLVTLAKIVGWIAWAILALTILLELNGRLRHVPVPRLRGFGLPQAIARSLVAAALGTVLSASPIMPALAGPALPTHTIGVPAHPAEGSDDEPVERYTVRKGDTLSEIALDHLGDGHAPAYMRIFDASDDTIQPDGRKLTDPDLIYPGWQLTIPDDDPPKKPSKPAKIQAAPTPSPTPVVTVEQSTPAQAPPTPAEPAASASTQAPDVADPAPTAEPVDVEDDEAPGWMLAGLASAGALLAGTLWLALRRHRAVQTRGRRPGRVIPLPPPSLAVVEKTIRYQGEPTSDLIERVHSVLQRLAARLHDDQQPVPTVLGVEVAADGGLTLRLSEAATLPDPFEADTDPRTWRLEPTADLDVLGPLELDREPVWPALATVGRDDARWRMLNLEALGLIALTGDRACAEDLARHWACELALLPWADMLRVECHQLFDELASLGPHGVTHHTDHEIIAGLIQDAVGTGEGLAFEKLDTVEAARAAQVGDIWVPHLLLTASPDAPRLVELVELVASRPGQTAVAVATVAEEAIPGAVEVRLTAGGLV
ncbi:MAG: LysM peptidoglycan-binding domain-containing protein, partial [Propionicimonas sp.]|nr:LysM peptidoglycan-binding domain-containing protein [Propionicimonas sp.]